MRIHNLGWPLLTSQRHAVKRALTVASGVLRTVNGSSTSFMSVNPPFTARAWLKHTCHSNLSPITS